MPEGTNQGNTARDDERFWAEDLPPNCPPPDARQPTQDRYFRAARWPLVEGDFKPQVLAIPVDPCLARALSMWDTRDGCRRLLKGPAHRGKEVICLELPPAAGVVKRTGKGPGHYSWWVRHGFDPSICATLIPDGGIG